MPISDGVHGHIIQSRDRQDLKGPLDVVFIDRGREDGVASGDVFEVRRRRTSRLRRTAETVDEVMATGPGGARPRAHRHRPLAQVTQPNIRPGAGVRQVAKLPS